MNYNIITRQTSELFILEYHKVMFAWINYLLFSDNYISRAPTVKILKSGGDTSVDDLITDSDESVYRKH